LPDHPSLTLVLGGARSGKSAHAEALVMARPAPWYYVATGQAFDEEMAERIAEHKARRPEGWITIDAPLDAAGALERIPQGATVLLDCLTLFVSNHLLAENDVAQEGGKLADALAEPRGSWIVVSNEVGLGIVPDNVLARKFRDAAGRLNQQVARVADTVILMVAGLPQRVK